MATRKKTTVYIEEPLLRAAKVAATRSGKHEYEIFDEARRVYLGIADTAERIWTRIPPEEAPGEEKAARIAAEEVDALRASHSSRRTG